MKLIKLLKKSKLISDTIVVNEISGIIEDSNTEIEFQIDMKYSKILANFFKKNKVTKELTVVTDNLTTIHLNSIIINEISGDDKLLFFKIRGDCKVDNGKLLNRFVKHDFMNWQHSKIHAGYSAKTTYKLS